MYALTGYMSFVAAGCRSVTPDGCSTIKYISREIINAIGPSESV
jgi:hypothetical protein